jgi:hypothetical protein
MKYFPSPKTLNLGLQDLAIQKKFPSFKLHKKTLTGTFWIGKLQPKLTTYTVKVQYDPHKPKVYIIEPEVISFAPHRYEDESLCLYHPNDNSFTSKSLIADTIIPWTAEWLYFYEIWLEEGVWWGKEAPHSPSGNEKGV